MSRARFRTILLAVGAALALAGSFGLGRVSQARKWSFTNPRRVKAAPSPAPASAPPSRVWQKMRERPKGDLADRQEVNEAIASVPYLQGYTPARGDSGVTRHEEGAAWAGVNFYYSGHAPEAYLMDMRGRVVHRWRLPFENVFPGRPLEPELSEYGTYWRRAHLLPDGGLIVVYQRLGLVRLDARSNVLWAVAGGFHHDLAVDEDGRIVALDGDWSSLSRINKRENVLEDFVTVLGPDGGRRERFSLLEAFEKSDYAPLLQDMKPQGDLFHTNALKILEGTLADRIPSFRKGNLLVSMNKLDTVAVVDPRNRQVVWALSGLWQAQHEPVLLPSGRMLVFDNLGRSGSSRIVEFDPLTQKLHWQYAGGPDEPFASWKVGVQQRLPNGNTLITESTEGRAFEVTPLGHIVWEFMNPARAGEARELIATLYELRRFGPEWSQKPWLNGGR